MEIVIVVDVLQIKIGFITCYTKFSWSMQL